jgi:hypothetical protein
MRDGALVMCAVTNDLLDMERLRSGTLVVEKAAVPVRSAVDACVDQVCGPVSQVYFVFVFVFCGKPFSACMFVCVSMCVGVCSTVSGSVLCCMCVCVRARRVCV